MKITCATPSALRSQLASASRIATARCEGICSTTSLTPVATTARSKWPSAPAWFSRCSRCSVCAEFNPERATSFHCTSASSLAASSAASGAARASRWCTTPTPAADESPAISKRSGGPLPTLPWRSPSASGSLGVRARVRIACATSSGVSSTLAASDIGRLRTC